MKKPILTIEGGTPLSGTVTVSGSKDSALKLMAAAMFSNEEVVLENVPRLQVVYDLIDAMVSLGASIEWSGRNRLIINCASVSSIEIPESFAEKYRVANLLVPSLIFRFGKAVLPKISAEKSNSRPINRLISTWEKLGIEIKENPTTYFLEGHNLTAKNINFEANTHIGTDSAILMALFISGETTLSNTAEEPEVDDLIDFCNLIGGEITRSNSRELKIVGHNVFKGGTFSVQGDKDELVLFTVVSLMTEGTITIRGADKAHMLSFLNTLSKMGARFEFSKNGEMRVWHATDVLEAVNVTTSIAPGFLTDWQYGMTLLLTKANGESLVHETIYTDNFSYIKDLNRMGAKIRLAHPSEKGIMPIISNDSYDIANLGEPYTLAIVNGPAKLKGVRMHLGDPKQGAALVMAALSADGKTEIENFEVVETEFDSFYAKLSDLGANISTI